jgi:hypothetical protein
VRKYERLKVHPGKALDLVILSEQLESLKTHHVDNRTVPCTLDSGKCWLDHALVGKERYGGWLAVKHPLSQTPYLVCLTAVAVAIEPRLKEFKDQLRGLTLKLWRIGNHDRSEMNARLFPELGRATDLQPCPDVRYLVERMMLGDDRHDGANARKYGTMSTAFRALGGTEPNVEQTQGVKP